MRLIWLVIFLFATHATAQPVEFDPSDFGKIVISSRQSTSGFTLEQAFGDYQNEPVVKYGENGQAVRMGRPVGRLDLMYKSGKPGFCTAFIVDAQHIVTNHHCIPGMDGDPTGKDSGVAAAQFVAGYIKPGHDLGADKYTVSVDIVETNRALDYTVLRVFGDPAAKYGTMELADADPEDAEFLWIIGHPQGQSQHISREGCAASSPAISTEGKLIHTCDTLGGNSGSPVIRISDRKVVGLHHAGDSRTGFNMAIPMRRILSNSEVLVAAAAPLVAKPVATVAVDRVATACLAKWTEAKTLGCLGYETYLEECGDHDFAGFASKFVARNCTVAKVLPPPEPVGLREAPAKVMRSSKAGDVWKYIGYEAAVEKSFVSGGSAIAFLGLRNNSTKYYFGLQAWRSEHIVNFIGANAVMSDGRKVALNINGCGGAKCIGLQWLDSGKLNSSAVEIAVKPEDSATTVGLFKGADSIEFLFQSKESAARKEFVRLKLPLTGSRAAISAMEKDYLPKR